MFSYFMEIYNLLVIQRAEKLSLAGNQVDLVVLSSNCYKTWKFDNSSLLNDLF